MRRALAVGAVAAVVIGVVGGVLLREHGTRRQPVRSGRVAIGATPPATRIRFALSLRMDTRGLARALRAYGDPRSPAFERRLTAAAVGRRFGLPLAAIATVRHLLAARGIAVMRSYPQRTAIDVRASVATLDSVFGVSYRDYVDPNGTRFHAPVGPPHVPRALVPFVEAVVGLSTRPSRTAGSVRTGALSPADGRLAYDVAPLIAQHADGRGLSIAIASYQSFEKDDVARFRDQFKIDGPFPRHVPVGGGIADSDKAGHDEDSLDVDVISGIAPGAQILNYEAPNTEAGELAMLNAIAAGKASVASYSWGTCDRRLPAKHRAAVEHAIEAATLRGITFYVASGDTGAYACQRSDFANHALTVDFPSDSPSVVSVGGTLLLVRTDGTYLGEAAWEGPLANAGSGGGVNTLAAAPSWQRSFHAGAARYRSLPDVSAAASPDSGWVVRVDGSWAAIGGTSAAAPFWAASMLVAQQYADARGQPRNCFMAPILYALAFQPGRYPAFHDVTVGGNRFYRARAGWDYASGLGSPDVYNLARDLRVLLEGRPKACV